MHLIDRDELESEHKVASIEVEKINRQPNIPLLMLVS